MFEAEMFKFERIFIFIIKETVLAGYENCSSSVGQYETIFSESVKGRAMKYFKYL